MATVPGGTAGSWGFLAEPPHMLGGTPREPLTGRSTFFPAPDPLWWGGDGTQSAPHEAWGCSSLGRAPEWHSGGMGFDSPQLHHASLFSPPNTTLGSHPPALGGWKWGAIPPRDRRCDRGRTPHVVHLGSAQRTTRTPLWSFSSMGRRGGRTIRKPEDRLRGQSLDLPWEIRITPALRVQAAAPLSDRAPSRAGRERAHVVRSCFS
jgi:hypothetical protein